jgi:hypothetical protein
MRAVQFRPARSRGHQRGQDAVAELPWIQAIRRERTIRALRLIVLGPGATLVVPVGAFAAGGPQRPPRALRSDRRGEFAVGVGMVFLCLAGALVILVTERYPE